MQNQIQKKYNWKQQQIKDRIMTNLSNISSLRDLKQIEALADKLAKK